MFPLNPDADILSKDELNALLYALIISKELEFPDNMPRKQQVLTRRITQDLIDDIGDGLHPIFDYDEIVASLNSVVSFQAVLNDAETFGSDFDTPPEIKVHEIYLPSLRKKLEYLLSQE